MAFVGEGGETNPAALGLDRRRGVRLGQFDCPSCPGTCLSRGLDPPPRRAHITGFSLLGSLAAVREDGTSRAFAGVRFPWARAGGAGVSLSSALILSRALIDYRPFPSQPGPVGLPQGAHSAIIGPRATVVARVSRATWTPMRIKMEWSPSHHRELLCIVNFC